ncbi:MAG: amidohydrolase family protein [Chitinophagales bacterium]
MKTLIYSLALLIFFSCTETKTKEKAPNSFEFKNAYVFNGEGFEQRDFYIIGQQFVAEKPDDIDSSIDLSSHYIIPPFAEAHNHNIESQRDFDAQAQVYLRKGVFYVKIPNNIAQYAKQLKPLINKPESIDVVFANGGITGSGGPARTQGGGHPTQLYEMLQNRGIYPSDMEMENKAYYYVDSEADLEEKWPLILEDQPDFIKTYLLYSDNKSVAKNAWRKGLDSELLPLIVQKTHKEGLKVTTHVETSKDFHNAVQAGVDEINHLPGYNIPEDLDSSLFLIDEADAILAAEKEITVVTTLLVTKDVQEWSKPMEYMRAVQMKNLRLLKEKGVKIAAGSDTHHSTVFEELLLLESLELFSPLELMKIACENSASAVFPERKIGKLKPDYEASFLVLKENPLDDFKNIRSIKFRYKQGGVVGVE